ncbi:SH3 domain-containing protein [Brevibacillus sp. NRS-1366]|uniref:SH3 domain-containing protein n=1 Tax=Brevibacillus sp. NRS-1366 TaxID=3233899 RepID=UPI003D1971BC
MTISSYQKSLWARNILLVLFSIALIAALVKVSLGYKKMTLYEQAQEYYNAQNLIKAEQLFSSANDITAISYGDEQWNSLMLQLSATRQQLEALLQEARSAISAKQDSQVLETYERYQALRQNHEKQQGELATYFQQLSSHLGMEKEWADYYKLALQDAKDQSKANLAQENYQNESFIRTLVTIPDEYFGGTKKKQSELATLFQHYEKTKLRMLTASHPFADVVAQTAKSLRVYREIGIKADWLVTQLERFAQSEINQSIHKKDLTAFIEQAIAYRKIEDVLPSDSAVLMAITRHLESRIEQAEQHIRSRQFTKAIELYQELNALMDTSKLISGAEEQWLAYDPARLLKGKYPDKTFSSLLSGTERWGAKLYAFGLDEADQRLYFAAKMPDDSLLYLDQALSEVDMKSAKASNSEKLGEKEAPLIMIEATGKERLHSYIGVLPDLSKGAIEKRFSLEADEFTVIDSRHVVVKNAVGKGEQEFAVFTLDESGLVYDSKIADSEATTEDATETDEAGQSGNPPSGPPPDGQAPHQITVYAGPGEEYEMIGQPTSDSSMRVVTELNGWYQIEYDGKDGWIRTQ